MEKEAKIENIIWAYIKHHYGEDEANNPAYDIEALAEYIEIYW